jgi:molybdopterin-guanine dinucleotide biosynthesis protein B
MAFPLLLNSESPPLAGTAVQMRLFGLAGWSGSGKTTLLSRVIPLIVEQGCRVSTVKHAHHAFDIDTPGKDSHTHRMSGATEVLVASRQRWALMHELRGAPEPSLVELLSYLGPADLVLIEGFKRDPHPKLEVYRPHLGKPLLYPDDPAIVGIASDAPLEATRPVINIPVLDINDTPKLAAFILKHAATIDQPPR